jgi:hypothetical protein
MAKGTRNRIAEELMVAVAAADIFYHCLKLFETSAEENVARPERFHVLTGKRVRR